MIEIKCRNCDHYRGANQQAQEIVAGNIAGSVGRITLIMETEADNAAQLLLERIRVRLSNLGKYGHCVVLKTGVFEGQDCEIPESYLPTSLTE